LQFARIADHERRAAKIGSAPEGAPIVQFGRLDRVTSSSPIAVPLVAIRVEVSAVGRLTKAILIST
jgi:hypothetical protein